jgi:hypothetical protein
MNLGTLVRLGLCAPPLLALLLLLLTLYRYAAVVPVSFDGALNLNTAASLVAGTGYGLFYDAFFPFPAQTDGPFILPAALLIWVFGVSPLVTQAVNLAYVAALILLLVALLVRLGLPLWAALAGTLATVSVPGFAEYGMNGYGEVPAFTWYIAGILVLGTVFRSAPPRAVALLAGVFLALSYLTKVVALVLVVPVFAVAVWFAWRKQFGWAAVWNLCLGFVVPVLSWEAYRLLSIGSVGGYAGWWKLQLGQVFHQSGASHGFGGLVTKAVEHCLILRSLTGLDAFVLLALLVLPVLLFLAARTRLSPDARFLLLCLLLSGALYFAWWILLTPTSMTWLRRIVNGLMLHQLLIVALAFAVVRPAFQRGVEAGLGRVGALVVLFIAALPVLGLARHGVVFGRPLQPPGYGERFIELAAAVRALPEDALIFGTGWWQAPGLALYSGRKIHNFQRWTPEAINRHQGSKYFVFDSYALQIGKAEVDNALALTDAEQVYKSDAGELHRIVRARPYAPLDVAPADVPRLKTRMDFSEGDYHFKRGFYPIENGKQAWMRTHALVVLGRKAERRLIVELLVPSRLVRDGPVNLRVEVPGCADQIFSLSKEWDNLVEVELKCPPSDERSPLSVRLHVDRHMPFVNQLDADNRLLGVLVRAVVLAD